MSNRKLDLAFAITKIILGFAIFFVSLTVCILLLLIWLEVGYDHSVSKFLRGLFTAIAFAFCTMLGFELVRSGAKNIHELALRKKEANIGDHR